MSNLYNDKCIGKVKDSKLRTLAYRIVRLQKDGTTKVFDLTNKQVKDVHGKLTNIEGVKIDSVGRVYKPYQPSKEYTREDFTKMLYSIVVKEFSNCDVHESTYESRAQKGYSYNYDFKLNDCHIWITLEHFNMYNYTIIHLVDSDRVEFTDRVEVGFNKAENQNVLEAFKATVEMFKCELLKTKTSAVAGELKSAYGKVYGIKL